MGAAADPSECMLGGTRGVQPDHPRESKTEIHASLGAHVSSAGFGLVDPVFQRLENTQGDAQEEDYVSPAQIDPYVAQCGVVMLHESDDAAQARGQKRGPALEEVQLLQVKHAKS